MADGIKEEMLDLRMVEPDVSKAFSGGPVLITWPGNNPAGDPEHNS